MLSALVQFILSALVIIIAGSLLTKFADRIAEITGWGRLFVGGLLLAAGTSLPELMVDMKAVRVNLPDLAVGDLLGSSLFNILILAFLDFAYPSAFRRTAFSSQNVHHSLSAVLSILLTAIVGMGILAHVNIEFFGASIFAWILCLIYFFGLRLIFMDSSKEDTEKSVSRDLSYLRGKEFLSSAFGYLACALGILGVAPLLVEAADDLAKQSGLGHTFVGTIFVALATSLPEMVSTFAAFRIGSPDLALGNIFGSNTFNMILFLPLDIFYEGSLLSSVRRIHAVTAFCVVTVMSVAVMGHLYRKKERSRFTEPSSEIIFGLIILFLFLLYKLNAG